MIAKVALFTVAAFSVSACVDGGPFDPPPRSASEASAASARGEIEVRGYEWRLAELGAELRDERIRNDAARLQLLQQVGQLTEQNAALAERLGALEGERASAARPGAHDEQVAAELERLARILASNGGSGRGARQSVAVDDDDRSAFGGRK